MGSAVAVGIFVIGGVIFGIPLVVSIIRAIRNKYIEMRDRTADLMEAERGLSGFNMGNNDGSLALDKNWYAEISPSEDVHRRFAVIPEQEELPVYSNDSPPEYMEVTEAERTLTGERSGTEASLEIEETWTTWSYRWVWNIDFQRMS